MKRELPVVAVVPAYNEEERLGMLLHQLASQEYSQIYVIDDASTDNTYEVADSWRKYVKTIRGESNLGSGGNRNRIIPELGRSALIHFVDADMRLNTTETPNLIKELASKNDLGYISGLIRNPDKEQNPYNFGPRMSFKSSFIESGVFQYGTWAMGAKNYELARKMRGKLDWLLHEWPNTFEEPVARPIYWGVESNMVIPSEVFSKTGGYNEKLRYHETMEYSIRLDRLGLGRYFEPSLDSTHCDFDRIGKKFTAEPIKATLRIIGWMGLREFLFPPSANI